MRALLAVALFIAALLLQFRLIHVFRRMMDEVNREMATDDRIPEIGPTWLRGRVIRLHRKLFPDSTSRREMYALWCAMMAVFVLALACVVRFV